MKQTVCLILLIGLLSFSGKLAAQEAYRDVVTLNNGSIIKGITVDVEAPESIGIRTSDGNLFIFKRDEIESIEKEIVELTPPLHSGQNNPQLSFQKEKKPGLAFLFSFLLPGGGQYYNGEYVKGGIMTGLAVASYTMMYTGVVNLDLFSTNGNDGLLVAGMLIYMGNALWSMIDAPIVSSRINKLANIKLSKNTSLHIRPDYAFSTEMPGGRTALSPSIGMKISLSLK